MSRLLEILSRQSQAREEQARREKEAADKARLQKGKRDRDALKRERQEALNRIAQGNPESLTQLLANRWSLDIPQDSSVPVDWEQVRREFSSHAGKDPEWEQVIPSRLPVGWRLYRLSLEEASVFADYLMGDGWLLVTPTKAYIVVPGEMGDTIQEHVDERAAREDIARAAQEWREMNGEE